MTLEAPATTGSGPGPAGMSRKTDLGQEFCKKFIWDSAGATFSLPVKRATSRFVACASQNYLDIRQLIWYINVNKIFLGRLMRG